MPSHLAMTGQVFCLWLQSVSRGMWPALQESSASVSEAVKLAVLRAPDAPWGTQSILSSALKTPRKMEEINASLKLKWIEQPRNT